MSKEKTAWKNPEFDRVIHQPTRTILMAHLASHGPTDFTTLKTELNLHDGDMATHMGKLVKNEYVEFEKDFIENKTPRTTHRLSGLGKKRWLHTAKF